MENQNSEKYLKNIVNGNYEWVKSALERDHSLHAVLNDCAAWLFANYPTDMKQHILKLHDFAVDAIERLHKREIKKVLHDWDEDRENLIAMYEGCGY